MKQTDTTISKVMAATRAMAPKDVTTDELVILLDNRYTEVQVRNSVVNYLGRQHRHKRRATVAYDPSSRTVSWIGPTGRKTTVAVQNELPVLTHERVDAVSSLITAGPTAVGDAVDALVREHYPEHAEPREDGTWEADDEPHPLDALGDDTLPREPKKGDPGHRDHLSPEARAAAREKALITNRLTRINKMMRDLGYELNGLTSDMVEWREKARRYDELERKFREM